jgi:ATP synthase mitochondrial F1 complex assembly factor 2
LKQHLIPLTGIASRAHDISLQDRQELPGTARADIVKMLMRYLDTDTLLCWAPTRSAHDAVLAEEGEARRGESLREKQIKAAQPIIAWLATHVWPGVEIRPVLEENSILPTSQSEETKAVIRGWLSGLGAWELAGLERAVLAGKSLCVGVRLVVEWAEGFRDVGGRPDGRGVEKRFGIEEAARACSMEVAWQTDMWGEVEDTHDVEKEDLRRQLGSVILLVSGTTRP